MAAPNNTSNGMIGVVVASTPTTATVQVNGIVTCFVQNTTAVGDYIVGPTAPQRWLLPLGGQHLPHQRSGSGPRRPGRLRVGHNQHRPPRP